MSHNIDFNNIRIMYDVVGCCFKVHKKLGTHMLERAYRLALSMELGRLGYEVREEECIDMHYDGEIIPNAFRCDLLVNGTLIIEIKATDELTREHHSQLSTYLELSHIPYGVLVNFHSPLLKNGLSRKCLDDDFHVIKTRPQVTASSFDHLDDEDPTH